MVTSYQGETALALRLLSLAYSHARRVSLSPEDAQDCASEFFLKHWASAPWLSSRSSILRHRCASRHALNYRRSVFRHRAHTISLEEVAPAHLPSLPFPETGLGRQGLFTLLFDALHRIDPEPRALFLTHYVEQTPISEIALSSSRSEGAIRQSLYRTRRQLQSHLSLLGWTETALRELLL